MGVLLLTTIFLFPGTLFPVAYAAIPLNGEQHGEYERREYAVSRTVVVPAGETMLIHAGSVLRFHEHTGLVVKGTLICTAEPDTVRGVLLAGPGGENARWRGIAVDSGGSLRLEKAYVYNGICGIKASADCVSAVLKKVRFRGNVADVIAGSERILVDEGRAFSYYINVAPELETASATGTDPGLTGVSRPRRGMIAARVCLGAAAVAGGALAGVLHMKHEDYARRYETAGAGAVSLREKGNRALNLRNA